MPSFPPIASSQKLPGAIAFFSKFIFCCLAPCFHRGWSHHLSSNPKPTREWQQLKGHQLWLSFSSCLREGLSYLHAVSASSVTLCSPTWRRFQLSYVLCFDKQLLIICLTLCSWDTFDSGTTTLKQLIHSYCLIFILVSSDTMSPSVGREDLLVVQPPRSEK